MRRRESDHHAEDGLADVAVERLDALVGGEPFLRVDNLCAGYAGKPVLRDVSLRLGRGQSLCLIGPNGAGKSTVLNALFGFGRIFSGRIAIGEGAERRDITRLPPQDKLADAGIAYVLQDSSLFPEMTVEENLWMGGFLKRTKAEAERAAERIFDNYPHFALRRRQLAGALSGGERRLLEIARALMMDPPLVLLDEPSIGLEPRTVDEVFDMLRDLQRRDRRSVVVVEQNVRKALEFADIACVMVSGRIALAARAHELADDPDVEKLFLSA